MEEKYPQSWMYETFTKEQLDNLNDDADKEIEENPGAYQHIHAHDFARDKVLYRKRKAIEPPFEYAGGKALEHFIAINNNLFFSYPHFIFPDELSSLGKSAGDAGFKVQVDPFASRARGSNVRIVIWKQTKNSIHSKKMLKND